MPKKRTDVARFELSTLSRTKMWHSICDPRAKRSIQQNFRRCCFTDRCRKRFQLAEPKTGIENIENTCPSLLTAIKNSYSNPSKLFVNKKNHLLSRRDDPGRSTSNGHVQSSHNTPPETFINRRCNPELVRRRRKRSR